MAFEESWMAFWSWHSLVVDFLIVFFKVVFIFEEYIYFRDTSKYK
jgi:hypothetical protein